MDSIDLLIVGPAGRDSGGIARYIAEHERSLPETVRSETHDISTPPESDIARSLVGAAADALRFPLRARPDIVHVHTSHYNSFYLSTFYVFFAAFFWQRPIVVHVHGSSFDEFVRTASPPVARLQAAVFDMSDRTLVLSEHWREVLSERVPEEKLMVLPNAVDPSAYDPEFGSEPPHVAFVSDHIERKGIRELTTAVAALDETGVEFEVTVAGSGPLSHHAESLAVASDRVTYAGFVSESEKRALLDRASMYVLPTYAEGLPIALLEGMAGGNAIVSTTVGSIPEVIGPDKGILIEPGDSEALQQALGTLVQEPETVAAMAKTNRELVERCYSWDRAANRLTQLYATLCTDDGDAPAPGSPHATDQQHPGTA